MDKHFYEQLVESLHDGVYFVNTENEILLWNRSAERITGYSGKEVIGHSCSDNILRHIDNEGTELCLQGCPLKETLRDGKVREADVFLHHREGFRVPVHVRVSPVVDAKGSIAGAVEIFSDNSRRINILREYEHLKREIYVDSLTEIGNRKYAEMNLEKRLKELKKRQEPFSVLFLDIDNFKHFNDTLGHNAGDRVLIMVARTIANIMRPLDSVCRWGGEEFIVIISSISNTALAEIAERIRVFVMRNWIHEGTKTLKITVSIGGTVARRDDTSESLIQRADELMYKSKRNGRNCVTIDPVNEALVENRETDIPADRADS